MKPIIRYFRFSLLILCILLIAQAVNAQQYSFGMLRNDRKYMELQKKSLGIRYRGVLPPAYSLKEYAPAIGNQGKFGTCTAWSTAYYMRTMIEARTQNLRGNRSAIEAIRFSPTYIYEKIKQRTDNACQRGSFPADALDAMKKYGNVLHSRLPYPGCGTDVSRYDSEAAQYRIEGYQTLFDIKAATGDKISRIKEALSQGENPVPIGMAIPYSFVSAKENWKASPAESVENDSTIAGYHALTIIGYDDEKFGGSFLIANSWGEGWGDKGYTWGNYNDVVRFTQYAFQVYSEIKPGPGPGPEVVALQSSMDFALTQGGNMPVESIQERGLDTVDDRNGSVDMITYKMRQPYVSGTSFKLTVNNSKPAYMYIIGSDDVNRTTKLFPYSGTNENISPLVPGKSAVVLPANNRSFKMDTQVGNDYFLVLVSEEELPFEETVSKIKSAQGNFKEKVYNALGSKLIAPADIQYRPNQVAFEVRSGAKGSIVPMLVMIEHR
ncbi:hypothetical protein GCM10023187_51990 [Nibrella viscosa]|uniref:Peptidase C1A papain C-terminal domain-containing protein n=1 Tax=Nibrella viscosa TaxID=1084524 RepID=A0ABP8KY48_9BACT